MHSSSRAHTKHTSLIRGPLERAWPVLGSLSPLLLGCVWLMSAPTYLLRLFAVSARLSIEVSKLPLTITFIPLTLRCPSDPVTACYADAGMGVLLAVPANIDHRPSTFVTRWVLKPPSFSTQSVIFSPRFHRPASCWFLIGCWPSPTCFQTFSSILTTSTLLKPKCWLLIGCYL